MSADKISENIDNSLLFQLKKDIGNKCINEGYIDKDSIQILKRSIGKINSSHLNGSVNFDIEYTANVCNPREGDIISCKVLDINTMGLLTESSPLTIVLPRDHHTDDPNFKEVSIGDEIRVSIIGSRFDLYDTQITAIGKLVSN
jgi:DNA-directed RNA polymerase subunit E'/Rpb7